MEFLSLSFYIFFSNGFFYIDPAKSVQTYNPNCLNQDLFDIIISTLQWMMSERAKRRQKKIWISNKPEGK